MTSNHPAAHRPGSSSAGRRLPITIDCGTCVMRATPTCNECVVTHLCEYEGDAVVFDMAEYRAVRLLSDAGLLPSLQHREADATG